MHIIIRHILLRQLCPYTCSQSHVRFISRYCWMYHRFQCFFFSLKSLPKHHMKHLVVLNVFSVFTMYQSLSTFKRNSKLIKLVSEGINRLIDYSTFPLSVNSAFHLSIYSISNMDANEFENNIHNYHIMYANCIHGTGLNGAAYKCPQDWYFSFCRSLFWVDSGSAVGAPSKIEISDLFGQNRRVIVNSDISNPRGMGS